MSPEDFKLNQSYNTHKALLKLFIIAFNSILNFCLVSSDVYSGIWNYFIKHYGKHLSNALFISFTILCGKILEIPFDLVNHFYIEKKFGYNKMTLRLFFEDFIKGYLIQAVLMSFFGFLLESIVSYFAKKFFFFLWIAIIAFAIVMIVVYPVFIAPLFNKFENLNKEIHKEKDLLEKIERLCKEFNFPLKHVYKIDGSKRSSHSQAYFFGIFNKQLVIYDTLIES